jgi:hypothetical protein
MDPARDCRADYGHALLKLENTVGQPGLSLGFIGIFENARGVHSRMREIATYRKPHPAWAAVSALLIATLLAVGASRAQQGVSSQAPSAKGPTPAPLSNPSDAEAAREKMIRKLNRIIIPRLEFREASVSDALKYLERQSNQWDTSEPEAEKRGVKFVLIKRPAAEPFGDARITVSLSNIPVIEVVKYVTSLANLKYRIRPDRVEVAGSWPDADVLNVREF